MPEKRTLLTLYDVLKKMEKEHEEMRYDDSYHYKAGIDIELCLEILDEIIERKGG